MTTEHNPNPPSDLKIKTARSLKWNTIDRLASQILYAVTGIVLANVVSQEDFGLVGALLVFQAFAILFSDSGFGSALLRLKDTTEEDYSSVFWFNLIVSVAIYFILWFCAPLIADIFQKDTRLIPLSKIMFITFVLNALSIIQINRLMKNMDVKQLAISSVVAQLTSGGVGIGLALGGYGAWALVWQSVALAGVKTGWLWATCRWYPTSWIKIESFRKIWRIGLSVFASSVLNTIFLTIYSFVIGAFYSLRSLGVYTQADKWSKMGSASLSQIFTSTFVPLLARVQDNRADFLRYMGRIHRFTAFLVFPFLGGLAVVAQPLFHTLFGFKWDDAILLFQILCIRGILVVLVSLYGNFMLALGYGRQLFIIEIVKDAAIAVAILSTVWFESISLLVWGQLWASCATVIIVMMMVKRSTGYSIFRMLTDIIPFAAVVILMCIGCLLLGNLNLSAPVLLLLETVAGAAIYIGIMKLKKAPELTEALQYLSGRFRLSPG